MRLNIHWLVGQWRTGALKNKRKIVVPRNIYTACIRAVISPVLLPSFDTSRASACKGNVSDGDHLTKNMGSEIYYFEDLKASF